jgi:hypothetical protein
MTAIGYATPVLLHMLLHLQQPCISAVSGINNTDMLFNQMMQAALPQTK